MFGEVPAGCGDPFRCVHSARVQAAPRCPSRCLIFSPPGRTGDSCLPARHPVCTKFAPPQGYSWPLLESNKAEVAPGLVLHLLIFQANGLCWPLPSHWARLDSNQEPRDYKSFSSPVRNQPLPLAIVVKCLKNKDLRRYCKCHRRHQSHSCRFHWLHSGYISLTRNGRCASRVGVGENATG